MDLVRLPMLSEERAQKMMSNANGLWLMYKREGYPYGRDYQSFMRWAMDQDRERWRRATEDGSAWFAGVT